MTNEFQESLLRWVQATTIAVQKVAPDNAMELESKMARLYDAIQNEPVDNDNQND